MRAFLPLFLSIVLAPSAGTAAEATMENFSHRAASIVHIRDEIAVNDLFAASWKTAKPVAVRKYWSGSDAPDARSFEARMLWSDTALYVRFETSRGEPLIISQMPDLSRKVKGLWDRDVCEIFIAPDKSTPNKYFEFEIAPTGEWIDLGIEVTPNGRITDWEYRSNMTSFALIEKEKVFMAIKIPFSALGKTPVAGDVWFGNLFRCVGKDPGRGYLAWQPTKTPEPAFHVPEAFGRFTFEK